MFWLLPVLDWRLLSLQGLFHLQLSSLNKQQKLVKFTVVLKDLAL